jgi:two-component system, OmpR family, aerobic respiration control sensor histidine kinase ArcB
MPVLDSSARHLMTLLDPPPETWRKLAGGPQGHAMLAHDIRSALNSVLGGMAVIDRSRLEPDLRLQVERVAAAAETLAPLVLAAIEEAPATPAERSVGKVMGLRSLLDAIERRWVGEAAEKNLAFVLEAAPDLPDRLRVDPVDLGRILTNLLGNAVKYSGSGVVRLRVTRGPEGGVVFVLQDEGPGLGDCNVKQIFDYGFRGPPLAAPGQGLGLHIAKLLTEAMGGRLWLSGRPEGGLEAGLALPDHLCEGDAAPGAPAAASAAGVPDLAGLRVLLAEDNPTNQLVASQMLSAMNARVTVAGDGMEALARFEEGDVDLVVVDIEMPRMSGLEVIRAIRSRGDRRGRTPIVALTAYAMKEHRLRIAEAGADGLISKPIVSTLAFGEAIVQHVRRGGPGGGPATAAADEPLVDLAVYESLAETIGTDMLPELLDRIISDLEAARAELAAARDPVDAARVRANSHILISVAGAFGAVRLQRVAGELNAVAHASDVGPLAAGVELCLAEVGSAVEFVRGKRALC